MVGCMKVKYKTKRHLSLSNYRHVTVGHRLDHIGHKRDKPNTFQHQFSVAPKRVRSAQNGTNLRLFKISFSAFWHADTCVADLAHN